MFCNKYFRGKILNSRKQGIYCLIFYFLINLTKTDRIDFNSHDMVEPKIIHGRHKTVINCTLEESGFHASNIFITYEYKHQEVILDLQLNKDFIANDHFLSYQKPNKDAEIKSFTKTGMNLCNYQGQIRNNSQSLVALSTCDGIRGFISDGVETFYIENNRNNQNRKHYLIRHSDLNHHNQCGFQKKQMTHSALQRLKRSPSQGQVRGPHNSNRFSSYVELMLVVDNKVYKKYDGNLKAIHQHCKDLANIVNAFYTPLNIFIALLGVVVWSEENMVQLSSNNTETLENFLKYRRDRLVVDHPNDNAQLLTGEIFDNSVVGEAYEGSICSLENSGGVVSDHSTILAIVASTMAHEMGHNLGMDHDTPDCTCQDSLCIMTANGSSLHAATHWSSCSVDQLNVALHHGENFCLRNEPAKLFDSPTCGNGFVEDGEDCDCGLPEYCDNLCCDPHTCKLSQNATCATGSCCDLTTCKTATAGKTCRESTGECDLPEHCNGESEFCPKNVFKRDAEMCKSGKAFCYQGSCQSRDDQCKLLWGPTGKSEDFCYYRNTNGTYFGNCGYNLLTKSFTACHQDDAKCGVLQCSALRKKLEFGKNEKAITTNSVVYSGNEDRTYSCMTASIDFGLQTIDPGMAPDGAKCGDGKMCVKQKCTSVESFKVPQCPDCHGNGVCNTNGNCHCHDGWQPPYCDAPGVGGSIDSGPAMDPESGKTIRRIMYILFLGVVPCCAIVAMLVWRLRQVKFNSKSNIPIMTNPNTTIEATTPQTPTSPNENNQLFGEFNGFTLAPLQPKNKARNDFNLHVVPLREAPPPPVPKHGVQLKANQSKAAVKHPVMRSPPPPPPPVNHKQANVFVISENLVKPSSIKKNAPNIIKFK